MMRGRLVAKKPDDPVIVVPMRKVFQSAMGFVEGCESFEPKQLLLDCSKNRSTHPFPSGHLTRAMLSGVRIQTFPSAMIDDDKDRCVFLISHARRAINRPHLFGPRC